MEFMNDFLEREAPAMKNFLHMISSGVSKETSSQCPSSSNDLDRYIDLGKQLSILHALLSECVAKVTAERASEVSQLHCILERVQGALADPVTSALINGQACQSLQRNIFRFNDPTVCVNGNTGTGTVIYQQQNINNSTSSNINVVNNNSNNTNNMQQPPLQLLNGGGRSPVVTRASTLPRNAYLAGGNAYLAGGNAYLAGSNAYLAGSNGTQQHHHHHHHHHNGVDEGLTSFNSPARHNMARGQLNGHHHPNHFGADDLSDLDGCCDLHGVEGGVGAGGPGVPGAGGHKGSQVSISTLSNVASSGTRALLPTVRAVVLSID
ncbi:ras GTPase-activating protein nGAP-like [Nilaparvata lugens]|uniref:ras GTPase-activating protein nGAP-like n=1 Tax=Nilaparvata lugens TaxID=108931 RepID=UPI00193DA8BA|nr:ras GTPase-activating protein nGAP-like [Nilaparvata lugens]